MLSSKVWQQAEVEAESVRIGPQCDMWCLIPWVSFVFFFVAILAMQLIKLKPFSFNPIFWFAQVLITDEQ